MYLVINFVIYDLNVDDYNFSHDVQQFCDTDPRARLMIKLTSHTRRVSDD